MTEATEPANAPFLSIVLPVFNEELVLERNLAAIVQWLDRRPFGDRHARFEIVAVDDGSRDRSAAILAAAAGKDARIRVLRLPQNRGKGAAVRTGMLAARGEFVAFMDADLSTPLDELLPLLAALQNGADAVLGTRRAKASRIERRQPWLRQTLGRGFTMLTRILLSSRIDDFTCGFKGFRQKAAQVVFSRSTLDRWAFDAELVAILAAQQLRVEQIPVRWRHEDDTKVRLLASVCRSLVDLARITWLRWRGAYR